MTRLQRFSPLVAAPFPKARRVPHWPAVLALALCPLMASAQVRSDALRAADPLSPVTARTPAPAAPVTVSAPRLPTTAAEALSLWQQANQRVAAFPRGHIDILRWEAGQASAQPPSAADAAPALLPGEALRSSLAHRPTLLARPGMNAVEQAAVQRGLLDHAHAVQSAWIAAVASGEQLRHQQARLDAAHSGAELGRRMVAVGNWSQARLLREQLSQAREHTAQLQAQQTALEAQEQLAQLMGQWDPQAIEALVRRLPRQLPELPAQPQPGPGLTHNELEAAVLRSDPTLALQRTAAQRQLAAVDPGWRGTWAQALQSSLQTLPSEGLPTTPLTIADPRLTNDHALQRALGAEATLLQTATERRSAARRAWARLQATHALARHAQETILPLQTALEQETQLRYNGMLQSTWDLLEASRERMQGASDAASARRDFWLAQLDWNTLLAGGDYAPADPSLFAGGARAAAATPGH